MLQIHEPAPVQVVVHEPSHLALTVQKPAQVVLGVALPAAGFDFDGHDDYPAAPVNTTLSSLIDRKTERTEIGGEENYILLFENELSKA